MSLAECENETTAPADWAIWTPFTLVGSWEIGLSEIVECLLNERQSKLVISHRGHFILTRAANGSIPTITEIHLICIAA